MKERLPSTLEQRQALRDEVFRKLEAGVASIQDSASFQRFLALQARFHHYSAGNVALILAQRPDAVHVASFVTWKRLERSVKRGEKGIRILAPTFGKDEDTGEQVLRAFIPVPVFDLAQTEGKPLPEPEAPLLLVGEEGPQMFDGLMQYAGQERLHVRLARSRVELAGANGDYNPRTREIRLNPNPMKQMVKTLAHEQSHHVHLTYLGAESADRRERETVAEGAAFVVAHHFGLETGAYSFPYIAAWARNRERLLGQLETIHKVSSHIIDALLGNAAANSGSAPDLAQEPLVPRALGSQTPDAYDSPQPTPIPARQRQGS